MKRSDKDDNALQNKVIYWLLFLHVFFSLAVTANGKETTENGSAMVSFLQWTGDDLNILLVETNLKMLFTGS